MKILGTLTVDTPNALDKVTDLNADLLDGKSSDLFLSRSSTDEVYIANTAIVIDNSITPTDGGGRLKIYDGVSTAADVKGLSIGKLYSDSAADITTIDADLHISLATEKVFKLFTNVTGVNSTNRLTVLATGNVGINKATPTAKLQVHVGAGETTLHPLLITSNTKTLFDVDFSGNIGINTAADGSVQLLLQGERTSTNGLIYGIKNDLTYAAASGVIASIYSMYIGTTITANNPFATATALFINEISVSGTTASAKYGIYQVGANDSNVFNGNVCIGTTTPVGKLNVNGSARLGYFDINTATTNAAVWISGSDFGFGTYYVTALKFLTNNTERMRIDSSGNVGIGTISPSSYGKLVSYNLSGGAYAISAVGNDQSNTRLRIRNTNGADFTIVGGTPGISNAGLAIFDETNNATRMLIDSSGNVGIGTNPSPWHSNWKAVEGYSLVVSGQQENRTFANHYRNGNGSYYNIASIGASSYEQYNGSHTWTVATGGLAGASFTPTTAMTLTSSGNVCIGTASPSEKLHVVGNILATGTVIGSNISNSYVWVFAITSPALTAYNTSDAYNASNNYVRSRTGDTVGSAFTNSATLPSFYDKNVVVYRSTTTSSYSAYEQVFPDITITTGGVCTISFAVAQTVGYVFRVIFS